MMSRAPPVPMFTLAQRSSWPPLQPPSRDGGAATERWSGRHLGELIVCALLYFSVARLGLALAFAHENASPVWPPTGYGLAAIYLLGPRMWPGLFIGALTATLVTFGANPELSTGAALAGSLGVATGNTLEALAGVALWRRLIGSRDPLGSVTDVLRLVAAVPAACAISATLGASSVWAVSAPAAEVPAIWLTWWLGDMTGAVVVAPVLLVWARRAQDRAPVAPASLWAWASLAVTVALTVALFRAAPAGAEAMPVSYLLLLPLLWIAFRHGQAQTATAVLLISVVAVWETVQGRGPFVMASINSSLLHLQCFIAIVSVTMLSLGAALIERASSAARAERLATSLEQRVAERTAELARAHAQLERAQRMEAIGTLAGGIAHDFNNLLTPISAGVGMARAKLSGDSRLGEALDLADQSIQESSALISQLLTFSRRQPPRRVPIDVVDVVSRSAELLRRALPANIHVSSDISLDEQGSGHARIFPDAQVHVLGPLGQLGQALLNLGVNARDAMPNGGRLHLSLQVQQLDQDALGEHPGCSPGTYAIIRVRDTGQGMSPDVLARLFEPFFTTKEAGAGTGLGLAMVYACVQAHQGFVVAHSRVGEGSTFELCLPVCTPPARGSLDAPAPVPAASAAAQAEGVPGFTVLLVDDKPLLLKSCALLLNDAGHQVLSAADAEHALALIESHASDIQVIVTDMVMPGCSGVELLDALRACGCNAPVVLMSGHGVPHDERQLRERGFADFLPKPFTPDQLDAAVRRAVASHE